MRASQLQDHGELPAGLLTSQTYVKDPVSVITGRSLTEKLRPIDVSTDRGDSNIATVRFPPPPAWSFLSLNVEP